MRKKNTIFQNSHVKKKKKLGKWQIMKPFPKKIYIQFGHRKTDKQYEFKALLSTICLLFPCMRRVLIILKEQTHLHLYSVCQIMKQIDRSFIF